MSKDDDLHGILLGMGFTEVIIPITKFEKFLNRFYKEPKHVDKEHDFFLRKFIGGKKCEVYLIDIWYIQLRVDDKVLFDARRFENEELLKLIPTE